MSHHAGDRAQGFKAYPQPGVECFVFPVSLSLEKMDLPWLDGINHSVNKRRIPSVLTRDKVAGVLARGEGVLRDASARQHTETRLSVKS